MSIPNQIRALEELAAHDAELKDLDEQLTSERSTLERPQGEPEAARGQARRRSRSAVAAMDKQRNELIADVRQMMTAARSLAREDEPRAHRARDQRRPARARGAAQADSRSRRRDRQAHRPTATPAASTLEATEAEAKKIQDELGAQRGRHQLDARRRSRSSARRSRPARDEVVKRLPPVLYRRYDTVRVEARLRHRADDRRHLQGLQHVAAAAALSPAPPRAAPRAVPVVQPHHLLRRPPSLGRCRRTEVNRSDERRRRDGARGARRKEAARSGSGRLRQRSRKLDSAGGSAR